MQNQSTQFGPVQIGIIVLTLATGIIHLVILNLGYLREGTIDPLFTLNGIGYLVLLIALFLPQLSAYRGLIRWALILFTATTILAWIVITRGDSNILGYVDKLLEVVLIVLLFVDRGR